ncbi:MAG: peptide chain release factor N(5)-glutamine methyltransferase [Bacteroidales bacterium]|nr:peptide chain release factor N(5)-glutamine methyltransferase [Bacteroidales bacterium]
MEVPSNKISDLKAYYKRQLADFYEERESNELLFVLFESLLGLKKSDVILNPQLRVSESELLVIHFAVKDLKNYKPIQYITGRTDFYDLTFNLNSNVLIPRPETEEMVDIIIKNLREKPVKTILDIGTGSGCIAIVLKKYFPRASVTAIEKYQSAIQVAKENAVSHGVQIKFRLQDFLQKVQWDKLGCFDLIVSNPPYVREFEKVAIQKNVMDYEPSSAIFVKDDDPLVFYKAIRDFAGDYLNENGSVFCEINQNLGNETMKVFENLHYRNIDVRKDLSGNDRFLILER